MSKTLTFEEILSDDDLFADALLDAFKTQAKKWRRHLFGPHAEAFRKRLLDAAKACDVAHRLLKDPAHDPD